MRMVLSVLGVIFGLGFIAASAGANFVYQWHQAPTPFEGVVFGALSASVSGFNALMPFFIAWANAYKKRLFALGGVLFLACGIIWSLSSALGFAASTRGQVTETRSAVTSRYALVNQQLQEAEAKRAALPSYRASAVVSEALEAIKQDKLWLSSKNCTDATAAASLSFCKGFFQVKAEAATAEVGERLDRTIEDLRSALAQLKAGGAGLDSDPQASLLARLFHLDVGDVKLGLNLFMAVLVELGAAFSIYFATAHSHDAASERIARERVAEVLPPLARGGLAVPVQRITPRRVRLLESDS